MAVVNSSTLNFEEVMQKALQSQFDLAIEVVTEVIPAVAKDTVSLLKKTSPKSAGAPTHGQKHYAQGWASKVETGRMRVGATVYGKHGTYQRAHLLERKHRLRDGRMSMAYPHISAAEDYAISEASRKLEHELEMRSR